jgi:hypothetical protein
MKIEVEIPDEYAVRHIYIMAGIEPVAKKEVGKEWAVKTDSCSMCGKCCMDLPPHHPMGLTEEGHCVHLEKENDTTYICGMRIHRPLGCCLADPTWRDDCSVRYEVIHGNSIR